MTAEFSSGTKRSEKYLPFWKLPLVALEAWASRGLKGEKYERDDLQKGTLGVVNNWKLAIGKSDREYIQQFWNHAFHHLLSIKEQCTGGGEGTVDRDGESIYDHCGALMWNAAAMVVYFIKDRKAFCEALNQDPYFYNTGMPVGSRNGADFESRVHSFSAQLARDVVAQQEKEIMEGTHSSAVSVGFRHKDIKESKGIIRGGLRYTDKKKKRKR